MKERVTVKVIYKDDMVTIPIGTWIELILFLRDNGLYVHAEPPTVEK